MPTRGDDLKTVPEMTDAELLALDAMIGRDLNIPALTNLMRRFLLSYRERCRAELNRRRDAAE